MLHLISQSPIDTAILARISPGDDVVCLDNAVLNLLHTGRLHTALTAILQHSHISALQTDLDCRGITAKELLDGITIINYPDFVGLTVQHPHIITWS
jgi:sulfur relay protein TusB/DsrH